MIKRSQIATVGRTWQLQTAKAQFSEVFPRARTEGPQLVTRQNKEAVVVLPVEQFQRLSGLTQQPKTLSEFFSASPLAKWKIQLDRRPIWVARSNCEWLSARHKHDFGVDTSPTRRILIQAHTSNRGTRKENRFAWPN